jgi:hypothetical protein
MKELDILNLIPERFGLKLLSAVGVEGVVWK